MMEMAVQYLLYILRWQLSTPILALVMARGAHKVVDWKGACWANLVGSLIFFWVDRWILCGSK